MVLERIVDPNKGERLSILLIAVFCALLWVVIVLAEESMLPVSIVVGVCLLVACLAGMILRPYVVISPNGVTVRMLFRKKQYAWKDLLQVGIYHNNSYNRAYGKYLFPLTMVLPGGTVRKENGSFFSLKNFAHVVILPRTKAHREMIQRYYGPLDFDDISELSDWERKYYGF